MAYTQLIQKTISDVTTEALDGTGDFDVLMRAIKNHIKNEYDHNRIQGKEYSQVYLAALQLAVEKSMEWALVVDKSWLEAEVLRLQAEKLELEKSKVTAEIDVLVATKCKLDAEFDVLVLQKDKIIAETALLGQKLLTEQAQTQSGAIDPESVVGKQITLYGRQADGFLRDAEQKAAKLMIDTWNVRRTTDEGTQANVDNKLQDTDVGRAVTKMLAGVNA